MSEFPIVTPDPGVTRQVLADHPQLMVVEVCFLEDGIAGAVHNHPHVQSTYVKSGKFRFSIDGKDIEVGAGDSFVIPANAVHGCECLEKGTLIDSFTPRRDDFL